MSVLTGAPDSGSRPRTAPGTLDITTNVGTLWFSGTISY